jgi:diacylglycerol kinase (ATP)
MRARVIYNPTSGRETLKKSMIDILQILEEAGYEASAYATTPEPLSAAKEAERAALAGFDLIVAAGGDGTVNEVVNGIAGLEKRPTIGIIPAGTTNDYARALKIPRSNLLDAARVIAEGNAIPMDIGQANDTYFINIAAGGYLTDLTYDVPTKLKTIFGYLAYLGKGAEKIPQLKPMHMRIEYENGIFDGMASMFFVALTNSVGGFETIDPNIVLGDGKFTLFIVKTANIFEILQVLVQVLNGGRHLENANVLYTHTSFVKAEALDGSRLMINLDGEYGGDAPTLFTNLQQHIQIIGNTSDYAEPIDQDIDEDIDGDIFAGAGTGFMKEFETLSPDEVTDKHLPYDGKDE